LEKNTGFFIINDLYDVEARAPVVYDDRELINGYQIYCESFICDALFVMRLNHLKKLKD